MNFTDDEISVLEDLVQASTQSAIAVKALKDYILPWAEENALVQDDFSSELLKHSIRAAVIDFLVELMKENFPQRTEEEILIKLTQEVIDSTTVFFIELIGIIISYKKVQLLTDEIVHSASSDLDDDLKELLGDN